MTTSVRPLVEADVAAWLRMRRALWPDGTADEHRAEIEAYLGRRFPRGPWIALIAEDSDGAATGFAEASVRSYAEGCATARVGYLEGWWVEPDHRGRGVGRALVAAVEAWARDQGCTEMASDADPANAASVAAHAALGFDDAGLVRCFRKDL